MIIWRGRKVRIDLICYIISERVCSATSSGPGKSDNVTRVSLVD